MPPEKSLRNSFIDSPKISPSHVHMLVMNPGLYILEFPPPVGGGKESKGLQMGKEMKGGKKRKKGNLGKI